MLLPSELFQSVISCRIVNSSIVQPMKFQPNEMFSLMKFKFIHKIFVIQEKFLEFFYLLRGPDITRLGAGSGPQAASCASLFYGNTNNLKY